MRIKIQTVLKLARGPLLQKEFASELGLSRALYQKYESGAVKLRCGLAQSELLRRIEQAKRRELG